jgi:hypothetical protein
MVTKKWFGHHQTIIPLVTKTSSIAIGWQVSAAKWIVGQLGIENFWSPSALKNGN